mmetsp:Transcript_54709/g.97597  ORF Transcript_54709/g.97597 Transcript_54709/m.97597 type:complete len:249 (+) Transcript_54709:468-1214(+)
MPRHGFGKVPRSLPATETRPAPGTPPKAVVKMVRGKAAQATGARTAKAEEAGERILAAGATRKIHQAMDRGRSRQTRAGPRRTIVGRDGTPGSRMMTGRVDGALEAKTAGRIGTKAGRTTAKAGSPGTAAVAAVGIRGRRTTAGEVRTAGAEVEEVAAARARATGTRADNGKVPRRRDDQKIRQIAAARESENGSPVMTTGGVICDGSRREKAARAPSHEVVGVTPSVLAPTTKPGWKGGPRRDRLPS